MGFCLVGAGGLARPSYLGASFARRILDAAPLDFSPGSEGRKQFVEQATRLSEERLMPQARHAKLYIGAFEDGYPLES